MLYTKKGDGGTTKLFESPSGVRISKDSYIFEALGSVDELNSHIGYAKAIAIQNKDKETLEKIQNILFSLQAELGGADKNIAEHHVKFLEDLVAEVESIIPPITSFIIPGGTPLGAYLDVCRTVARRAERSVIRVREKKERTISDTSIQFLNRLSSVFYALARLINYQAGLTEEKPNYK